MRTLDKASPPISPLHLILINFFSLRFELNGLPTDQMVKLSYILEMLPSLQMFIGFGNSKVVQYALRRKQCKGNQTAMDIEPKKMPKEWTLGGEDYP